MFKRGVVGRPSRDLGPRVVSSNAYDSVRNLLPHRLHFGKNHVLNLVLVELFSAVLLAHTGHVHFMS